MDSRTMVHLVVSLVLLTTAFADEWLAQKVVPDEFPNSPQQTLSVVYDSVSAEVGNELTPSQVHSEPKVNWTAADDGALYTLIMSDPDALAPVRAYLHWLVMNIRGSDLSTGAEVAAYQGAGPPPGTGAHRYVFSVWKQNREVTPEEYVVPGKTATNTSLTGRLKFSTVEYAKKVTGDENPTPVAGNFFTASFDDYVKILQAEFEKMMKNNLKNIIQH